MWAACACPVCRFVFRVPKNHEGKGVVCPACRYLLRLPSNEQPPEPTRRASNESIAPVPRGKKPTKPPVAGPVGKPASTAQDNGGHSRTAPGDSPRGTRRRRLKQKTPVASQMPEWEQAAAKKSVSSSGQGNPTAWILGGSVAGLTVVALGTWLVIGSTGKEDAGRTAEVEPVTIGVAKPEVKLTEKEKKTNREIEATVETGVDVLTASEPVVRKFLAAKTTEDFRPLVRNPEVAMPRIEAWYKTHPLEPADVKDVGYGGRVTVKGRIASLAIQMGDYTTRHIALERTDEGHKVDWESWVAWTEMDWDTLFSKRPTDPVTVLARCTLDTYYNRQFSDDKKWQAVRLTNPQSERTLYGYVDREDPSLVRFVNDLRAGTAAVTIQVRYPENAKSGDQVIISKHLHNGWVAPTQEEKKSGGTPPEQNTDSP